MGFTHRQTVLIIYGIAVMFGLAAIIFSMAKVWGAILLVAVILTAIEIFVEVIGLAGKNYKPLLNFVRIFSNKYKQSYNLYDCFLLLNL